LFIYWFKKIIIIEKFHQLSNDKIGQNWKIFFKMKIQEKLTRNWKILKTTNFEWIESFFFFLQKIRNVCQTLEIQNFSFLLSWLNLVKFWNFFRNSRYYKIKGKKPWSLTSQPEWRKEKNTTFFFEPFQKRHLGLGTPSLGFR
jgi:hypothetical protein